MLVSTFPKILVVDNTPSNLVEMTTLLEDINAHVILASSSEEALEKIEHHDFSLIFLDIQMPDVDGHSVAAILKSKPKTEHIPIIFLADAHLGETVKLMAYDQGAVDFIKKPVNPLVLLSKVQVFLDLALINGRLKQQEKNTRSTLDSIPDPIVVMGKNEVIYFNNAANIFVSEVSTHSQKGSLQSLFSFNAQNLDMIAELMNDAYKAKTQVDAPCDFTYLVKKNNKEFIYQLRATPLLSSDDSEEVVVLIFHDISESKVLADRLAYQSQYDSLTGLPNRRYFDLLYRTAIKKRRNPEQYMGLCLLGLDDFKGINDTLGHFAGDAVLKEVTKRIARCLSKQDILSRFSGDEFCVLIQGVDSEANLRLLINRILSEFDQPFDVFQKQRKLGISVGITSICFEDQRESAEILSDADLAMNQAKLDGGSCYREFETFMREKAQIRVALQLDLDKAFKNREFELYYQPQINIKSGEVYGFEALIRWNHPEKGLVPPNQFIDELENSGLILDVGQWVIDEVCQQLTHWKKQGYTLPCISVNVSPKQFHQEDFPLQVAKTLQHFELSAEHLGIEITETLFMNIDATVESNIVVLSEMGCKISLDDFGTGYSSLSYLIRFPIDVLKIDQVFIKGLLSNKQYQVLVSTLISMARGFNNMKIVAEGVELQEQLSSLQTLGCDSYQGYFFSKPLPVDEIESLLQH